MPAQQRLAYAATQAARVAFYGAHYLAARVLARDGFKAIEKPAHKIPSAGALLGAMRALFETDWRNVEAGLYPMPVDLADETRHALGSLRYLADIPRVAKRQKRHGHDEVKAKGAKDSKDLPRYYRQNFHYQTDGYLSERSARLYEFQVEALFAGTADAMRRQAFVPIARALDGSDAPTLLDIGAGTGRFLSFVKAARPGWKTIALDLSEPYLDRARSALRGKGDVEFVAAPAEAMPLADASVDAAVSIYLFHELPPKIRAAAAKEIARVLKPGGTFTIADTIQYGDAPDFDGLIDVFPSLLHEPYYASYVKIDLAKLFGAAGLEHVASEVAYLTKVATFRKPEPKRRK
ncbi:MAG TPA: class I SAM-dependent methyltransferase [Rhizomicrobium sp.]|jgi:ubiquinone/menaquinone biosynthesis C-methylase UbiE|nr:class I SAM-dependent methyltransferase [Rhizomicrobium sp.]